MGSDGTKTGGASATLTIELMLLFLQNLETIIWLSQVLKLTQLELHPQIIMTGNRTF